MLPPSHELLERAIHALESSAATGVFNTMVARLAGNACVVLGFSALAERPRHILAAAPESAFFAGAIINFTPDAAAFQRLRALGGPDEAERDFPPFRSSDVEEAGRWQEGTRLAWQRRYDDALAFARAHPREPHETSMVSEIASTAAVLGDFRTVEQLLRDETLRAGEDYAVRIILVIEYARGGHLADAERVFASLERPPQDWWSIHLALGLAGRRPWVGYPYSDY